MFSQNCPNADFSYLNYIGWTGDVSDTTYAGAFCPIGGWKGAGFNGNNGSPVLLNANPCIAGRHVIMNIPKGQLCTNAAQAFQNGYDPNCKNSYTGKYDLPMTPPGSATSIRLGSTDANCTSEKLTYSVNVTSSNTQFNYQYAVVVDDGGHPPGEQPALLITVVDVNGNAISVGCQFQIATNSGAFEQSMSPCSGSTVYYKQWEATSIDLTSYIGQTVYVVFETLDCPFTGHYCYAYISAQCGQLMFPSPVCDPTQTLLTTSPNYTTYQWCGPNSLTPISGAINDSLSVSNPVPGDIYYLECVSAAGCSAKLAFAIDTGWCVWPGDANEDLVVNNVDLLSVGIKNGISGTARTYTNNTWQGFTCGDWNDTLSNGFNTKYTDCDGSGQINFSDTLAINLNYNATHPFKLLHASASNPEIYMQFDKPLYYPGDTVSAGVYIGSNLYQQMNFYGSAFSLDYDETRAKSGSERFFFSNSWVGTVNLDMIKLAKIFPGTGYVDAGLVRTNHNNVNGFGKVAELKFVLRDTLSGTAYLHFSFNNCVKTDSAGQMTNLVAGIDSVAIVTGIVGVNGVDASQPLTLYPNPSTGNINVNCLEKIEELKVYDVLGKTVLWLKPGNQKATLQLDDDGVYFITVKAGDETLVRKVIVNR